MDEIKKAEEEITKTIRRNIRLLMQRHGLVLSRFCEYLENSGEKSFHRSLEKYMQTYHCYYHSTVSSENATDNILESLISGTLDIKPDGRRCKATLKIDTKKLDSDGKPDYKTYSGHVVFVSPCHG